VKLSLLILAALAAAVTIDTAGSSIGRILVNAHGRTL
jgi:hypothetical protein